MTNKSIKLPVQLDDVTRLKIADNLAKNDLNVLRNKSLFCAFNWMMMVTLGLVLPTELIAFRLVCSGVIFAISLYTLFTSLTGSTAIAKADSLTRDSDS